MMWGSLKEGILVEYSMGKAHNVNVCTNTMHAGEKVDIEKDLLLEKVSALQSPV